MDLQPIARSSASDEVYERLVASIVEGEVDPGDAMPSERSLSDALGVSRPVVREALKRLAHAGLVQIRHGGALAGAEAAQVAPGKVIHYAVHQRLFGANDGQADVVAFGEVRQGVLNLVQRVTHGTGHQRHR